ncbi:F-box domain-containing protein [Dioscorea alata]|uniref:F-box domain-containing protein n=3 Tax=Dioscorea alata TaxID=55571 RepID=A0ACB7VP14_DIOAL|nr:F-box domain-containing protein [Dioscorea alata]KAH7675803.1 F-box domain-containing protein [Dioscorea alata]KAH7675804.1 F-box domain-containing protein [Dioscorea alata]
MMLEKKYNTRSSSLKGSGLEFVQKTCILGRKRVAVVSSMIEESGFVSPVSTKMQKRLNHLEALPQDILVRVLCHVGHSDLRQLLLVSKSVQEATVIAKELHFTFSTPSKPKIRGDSGLGGGVDTPDAPKRNRIAKSRLNDKKLASIAVALFVSPED